MGAVSIRAGGPGTVDLVRGGVPEIQRARILAAVVDVARERGAGRVTVAHIVARSGVSRRTFYEMFQDRDACFLAAFQDAVARAAARVIPAYQSRVGSQAGEQDGSCNGLRSNCAPATGMVWRERVRAGLTALLEFLDEEQGLGGLCVVDALSAGPAVLERRAEVLAALVDVVDGGRGEAQQGLRPSRLTAEGVVGGVLTVLYARLATASTEPVIKLLSPLMGMIVLPYLGPGAAAQEVSRPAPRARRRTTTQRSNPLEGLDMRLTYRTVRVLVAVAREPDASNRQIAAAAGIQDQGQMSKLLTRLEHLGLVENAGAGPARGEPNAWRLTARGREVEQTISQQTTSAGI